VCFVQYQIWVFNRTTIPWQKVSVSLLPFSLQLMQREIKMNASISENSIFVIFECYGWWIGVKSLQFMLNPFYGNLEIGLVCFKCVSTGENWLKLQPKLPIQYFVFQSKIKEALNTDFINIHKYIKEITHL
jgi:hypothetical protein